MVEPLILTDRHGIPHHAYRQANGTHLLCPRKADLCRDCGEHGVPIAPPDPFEAQCDLFRAHWAKPWRDRFWSVPEKSVPGVLKPRRGAHIVALEGAGADLRSIDLGWFGEDDSIMLAIAALVTVHNDMIGGGENA